MVNIEDYESISIGFIGFFVFYIGVFSDLVLSDVSKREAVVERLMVEL